MIARGVVAGCAGCALALALAFAVGACAPAPRPVTANQPPVPILDAPATARAGEPVHLDGNASTDVDGAVSDAFLLFGDGSDPVIGFAADHVFAAPGLYLVELYVDDDQGATARARARVDVR